MIDLERLNDDTSTQVLSASQAAARLGVKVETLYAYVSRGLINRIRDNGSGQSAFSAEEISALAMRKFGATRSGGIDAVLRTAISQVGGEGVYYRGHNAIELANDHAFEVVTDWLWTEQWEGAGKDWPTGFAFEMPKIPGMDACGALEIAVAMAGCFDPERTATQSADLVRKARVLLMAMVNAAVSQYEEFRRQATRELDSRAALSDESETPIATRLWKALTGRTTDPLGERLVNFVLGVLADHDIAASTLAVRVVASGRADLYHCVQAGLSATSGRYHGRTGNEIYDILQQIEDDPQRLASFEANARERVIFLGFGHRLYSAGDPRARALLSLLEASYCSDTRWQWVVSLLRLERRCRLPPPNIDFALGAFAYLARMPMSAPQVLFAISRTAGWVAHIIEEFNEAPLRFGSRSLPSSSKRRGGNRVTVANGRHHVRIDPATSSTGERISP